MNRLTVMRISVAIVLVGALAASALAGGLKLHPFGFGKQSQASWKAQEGLPDSTGNADQALSLEKGVPTEEFAGGLATVTGLEGEPVSVISKLEWEHRTDGHCGESPFWGIGILRGGIGPRFTIRLSCAGATHSPGTTSEWTRDSYDGAGVAAAVAAANGNPATDTISDMVIFLNEGPHFVFLDNIVVNDHTWTSPADNGD